MLKVCIRDKDSVVAYLTLKWDLQGSNKQFVQNDLSMKFVCCVRICVSRMSGHTMWSPVAVYVRQFRNERVNENNAFIRKRKVTVLMHYSYVFN